MLLALSALRPMRDVHECPNRGLFCNTVATRGRLAHHVEPAGNYLPQRISTGLIESG
jgi:hypothetical protein